MVEDLMPSFGKLIEYEGGLLGHLHHAAKVVYPGRPFLRSLTDLLSGTRSVSLYSPEPPRKGRRTLVIILPPRLEQYQLLHFPSLNSSVTPPGVH